jgi:hypothetical protein
MGLLRAIRRELGTAHKIDNHVPFSNQSEIEDLGSFPC